jgi:DNA-binding transcriptional ArsR family regulator
MGQEGQPKGGATKRKPSAERKRPAEEAVSYAIGNGTRIDVLAILAEGVHSPSEIAKILGLDTRLVGNHIRELFACGCIESAGTRQVRNFTQHFYRALSVPHISDEAYREMPTEARREVIGVLVQAIVAETLASFRAGKLEADDEVCLMWDCVSLDATGKQQLNKEMQEHFDRILEIQDEAAKRLAKSEETGTTTFVSLTAFERSRPGPPESRPAYPDAANEKNA